MAEFSGPFTNGDTDGGPWSVANWWQAFRILTGLTTSQAGVTRASSMLTCSTPAADQVTVQPGHAILRGTVYENDAAKTLTATRPVVNTTGKRVVLRKDIANGGVALAILASADGTATLPALTDDADTLEISLASFLHTTAGAIQSLTDERTILNVGGSGSMITAGALDWMHTIAQRYVAYFGAWESINAGAMTADLFDQGWIGSAVSMGGGYQPHGAVAGDLDSASDYADACITVGWEGYLASPRVIGGRAIANALERVTGQRPTTCKVWIEFAMAGTGDHLDTAGVGVGNDGNAGVASTSGVWIANGDTNFEIWNGSTAVDTGVAKDTEMHELEIEIDLVNGTYRVLLDEDEVVADTAVPTDVWPWNVQAQKSTNGSNINVFACGVNYD